MDQNFNLEEYLSGGIQWILKDAMKGALSNPRETAFLAGYALAVNKGNKIRHRYELKGEHIPPFLIASITSTCNLHCAGCYARANNSCADREDKEQLTADEWEKVFREAKELGIAFILLAGGEPMVRKDVIERAAKYKNIIFPVFTNGTLMNSDYLELFDRSRNLIPVVSLEGEEESTDIRRGKGTYEKVIRGMDTLKDRGILFGTSLTVTRENKEEVTGEKYVEMLRHHGCRLVFYVEYVPVTENTASLAPAEEDRELINRRLNALRGAYPDMVFISFPGDEKAAGGCLAAGRGFFHINSHGGAEPCPFSPYSDRNIKETGLREALQSPLFLQLQQNHALLNDHAGGCALFEQKEFVESLVG